MAGKTVDAKLTNAERVRNNQRRSRARRKEYIAELEARIQQYESGHGGNPIASRVEELAKELDTLKRLLHSLGLDDKFLEAHSRAAQLASTWAQDPQSFKGTSETPFSLRQSVSQLAEQVQARPDPLSQTTNVVAQYSATRHSSECLTPSDTTLPWDLINLPTEPTTTSDSLETPNLFAQPHDHLAVHSNDSTTPLGLASSTTTLCTTAFQLVLESNHKGYSATDLDLKLRVGYQFSTTPLEGCRVDTRVLMDVLAEIS